MTINHIVEISANKHNNFSFNDFIKVTNGICKFSYFFAINDVCILKRRSLENTISIIAGKIILRLH